MANDQLRLIALDEQDLEVVSSHLQDAVVRVGEMAYRPLAEALRRHSQPLQLGEGDQDRRQRE